MSTIQRDLSRRVVLAGLAGTGLTAAAPKSLPNHLFSLTVWASGPTVEFLLLNIAEQPLELVWPNPPLFEVIVRDEEGWLLTDGFIPIAPAPSLTLADVRRRARRLRAWKAFKAQIPTTELYRLLQTRLYARLLPDARYALSFRMRIPVIDPAGGFQVATAASRSLCTWSFDDDVRLRTDCTGPLLTTESGG